jgi:hypothetical protein
MNFKSSRPRLDPKIDFAKLAADIDREDTPRVSEYAPKPPADISSFAPLKERIDHSSRLSMQEAADSVQTIITEILNARKHADIEHERMHRESDQAINMLQRAAKQMNDAIVKHSTAMTFVADVLAQINAPEKTISVEPVPSEPDDAA